MAIWATLITYEVKTALATFWATFGNIVDTFYSSIVASNPVPMARNKGDEIGKT